MKQLRSKNWKFSKVAASVALLMLATACSSTMTRPPTQTVETEREITGAVCTVWLPVSYSSRDTEQTIFEVRQNNAARGEYCDGG